MAGHLFVLRGDLTQLHCSAILVPCDNNWELVWEYWSDLLQEEQFDLHSSTWGARLKGGGGGRFWDVAPNRSRGIRLVVTADDQRNAHWVAKGVVEAIETFAKDLPRPRGRVKPLVTLPLVGTGAGGFDNRRGLLISALLPALRKAARDADIDVALVLRDDRDHAAVQGQRSAGDWEEFNAEHLSNADQLGARAARQELSLFLGSGVSVPLGLPDWKGLLKELTGKPIPAYSIEDAPFIAQKLQDGGMKTLHAQVAERMDVSGFAPAHLLLAALGIRKTVTTNYDTAYETALDGSYGVNKYRVLTRQLAAQPEPWILKLHGDVRRPESIVITTDDYTRLDKEHGSLHALVESLLLTSHLMFVGYSMGDLDFVKVADQVRKVRALAAESADENFATVLALHPGAVMQQEGFATIAMLKGQDDEAAARRLEIFLDRISWAAATQGQRSHVYLLDSDYKDLLADKPASTRLRDLLEALVDLPEDDPARKSNAWPQVEAMLTDLGARPREVTGH
jgi:hypothetical protein